MSPGRSIQASEDGPSPKASVGLGPLTGSVVERGARQRHPVTLDLVAAEGKLQWMHSSYGVQPVFPKDPVLLPTGTLALQYPVQTSGLAWNAGRRVPLGGAGGWHTLLYGAVVLSPGLGEGALWIETSPQKLCTLR